jgi:DNA-binding NtrC family response regulator
MVSQSIEPGSAMKHITKQHRWLVIDDDPSVLELTTEVLCSVPGSEVVPCNDARKALEIFFAEPETFELVVTDFNMPGVDGIELAQAMHKRAPTLKVLMVTGSDLEGVEGRRGELQVLLPKPCAPTALVAAVQAALAAPAELSEQFVSCETNGGRGVNLCVAPFRRDFEND